MTAEGPGKIGDAPPQSPSVIAIAPLLRDFVPGALRLPRDTPPSEAANPLSP